MIVLEALTGRNPFQRSDAQTTIAATLHEPAGIGTADPATAALDAVLQRCIAKDRQRRFARAQEMRAALSPALRSCPPRPVVSAAGDEADTISRSHDGR